MSEPDLRRTEAGGFRPIETRVPIGRPWWGPLLNKWGMLGVVIFAGLAIGFFEEVKDRLSPAATPSTAPGRNERTFREDLEKLDAASLAARLVDALSKLPTENPRQATYDADLIANLYNTKWQQEERHRLGMLPITMQEQQKREQNVYFQEFSREANKIYQAKSPKTHDLVEVMKLYIGKIGAADIHGWTNRITRLIDVQWASVSQMPLRLRQIREALDRYRDVQDDKTFRDVFLYAYDYVAANEIRRTFPSYQTELKLAETRAEWRQRLRAAASLNYDDASKLFLQSIDYIDADVIEFDLAHILAKAKRTY